MFSPNTVTTEIQIMSGYVDAEVRVCCMRYTSGEINYVYG